jgi:MFS family permease
MVVLMGRTFESLGNRNFRFFLTSAAFANTGWWMQRIAQDWVILQLTGSAAFVGYTTALQFLPIALLGPMVGKFAERRDKRIVVAAANVLMGLGALTLGILIVTGTERPWHLLILAAISGIASATDNPVRQALARDIVGRDNIANAVGLSSAVFHLARVVGPAIAGFAIDLFGSAAVQFAVVGSSVVVVCSLACIRDIPPKPHARPGTDDGSLRQALRRMFDTPVKRAVLILAMMVFAVTLNFQGTMTLMVVQQFDASASTLGVVASMAAVGSITGALLSARRRTVSGTLVVRATTMIAVFYLIAAFMPGVWWFAVLMAPVGLSTITFATMANAHIQLATPHSMQARTMALYLGLCNLGAPIWALLMGWIADMSAPRVSLGIAGLWILAATALAAGLMYRSSKSAITFDVDPTPSAVGSPVEHTHG